MKPVATRALVRIAKPSGLDAKIDNNGAIVTPVMNANVANKNLFKGIFVLQALEVKTIPS